MTTITLTELPDHIVAAMITPSVVSETVANNAGILDAVGIDRWLPLAG